MEEKDLKQLNMANRRKAIQNLYDTDYGVRNIARTGRSGSYSTLLTEDNINSYLSTVGSSTVIDGIVNLSKFAYATEPAYALTIDYLANMYLWRYYYLPILVKSSSWSYEQIYNLMSDIVDGLHIETLFPTVLTQLFKEGVVYLYTSKNTSSKTVSTFILNSKYCKPAAISQYGTGIFQFDVRYFDSFSLKEEKLEEVLEMFPKDLVKFYKEYKSIAGSKNYYFVLDGKYSTYISLNDFNFPSRLNTLKSIIDYQKYRLNEVERSSAQLDRIVTHKIPAYENQLLFELTEVQDLHKSMARIVNTSSRTKLMTTFGDVEVLPLQADSKIQSEILDQANKAIYNSFGLNANLFNSNTSESLNISLTRDSSIVWKYIQQLINFYNLTINNLFNFNGYQIELTMLPINHYNEKDFINNYLKNAEYGVGKLELIVATGSKQKDILHKNELENYLKLDEILQPLKSSHTMPGTPVSEEKEKVEEEEIVEDENLPIEK